MKHTKSMREKRAIRKIAKECKSRIPGTVRFGEIVENASFALEPFLFAGMRDAEFEDIAKRVGPVWVLSVEAAASRLEKYYGKIGGKMLFAQGTSIMHSVALVCAYAKKPKEFARWFALMLEGMPPTLHEDFIFLTAISAKARGNWAHSSLQVEETFAKAFSEDERLVRMLEQYLAERGKS